MINELEHIRMNSEWYNNRSDNGFNIISAVDTLKINTTNSTLNLNPFTISKKIGDGDKDSLSIYILILLYELSKLHQLTVAYYDNCSGRYVLDVISDMHNQYDNPEPYPWIQINLVNSTTGFFKKTEWKTSLETMHFTTDPTINNMLKEQTHDLITGIWTKPDGIIFEYTSDIEDRYCSDYTYRQMITVVMIYKYLTGTSIPNKDLHALITKLMKNDYDIDFDGNVDFKVRWDILKYIKDKPEYKIDVEKLIKELSTKLTRTQMELLETSVNKIENEANEYMRLLQDAMARLNVAKLKYAGVVYMLTQNAELEEKIRGMVTLLKDSKAVKHYKIENNGVTFTTVQPLHVNDEDEWEAIEKNIFGSMSQKLKKLMHETFIDHKYKLYTQATISLNLLDVRVKAYGDHGMNTTYLPHPHLVYYNCFGTYKDLIAEYIRTGEYDMVIEECIEAASGLNWADATVVNNMVSVLKTHKDWKTFQRNDGTLFSLREYEEEEANNEANKNNGSNATDQSESTGTDETVG